MTPDVTTSPRVEGPRADPQALAFTASWSNRNRMWLREAAVLGVLVGCFTSSAVPTEGGVSARDAGPDGFADARLDECEVAPGIYVCGRFCPLEDQCPLPESFSCDPASGICDRGPPGPGESRSCLSASGVRRSAQFCSDSDLCVVRRGAPDGNDCVPIEACSAIEEMHEGAYSCMYWDGSRYMDGPAPSGRCPPAMPNSPGFCGPGCNRPCNRDFYDLGGGLVLPGFFGAHWCAGVTEARDVGICTYEGGCEPGSEGLRAVGSSGVNEENDPLACLVEEREDGTLRREGVFVFKTDCRIYRELYPEFHCLDAPTWTELP